MKTNRRSSNKSSNKIKSSEHLEQAAFVKWCSEQGKFDERLCNLFAIPNGAVRTGPSLGYFLSEGLKPGVPDLFLAVPSRGFNGLFLEFKATEESIIKCASGAVRKSKSDVAKTLHRKIRPEQIEWIKRLSQAGFAVMVVWSFEEAKEITLKYLNGVTK